MRAGRSCGPFASCVPPLPALVEWEQEEDPGARELIALAYQLEREASLQEIDAGERELLSLTLRS